LIYIKIISKKATKNSRKKKISKLVIH